MNTENLIHVEGVSKKFCRSLKRSLWYGAQDIGNELLGRRKSDCLRTHEFWAVQDMNFALKRGECLGLIGHNGAGKSTLLKMLNGLIKPDKGSIRMKGRVGALIELGTGFNPILTGRENIYNNGAVLGFTKNEIDKKFDSIVEFSEIGEFIDTPVQNYSSGMKVRLGFSIAAQMDPDVLLVDEVLAVGDLNFKLKCFNLIDEIVEHCAVIFVSHSMQLVSRLCNQILMMENGVEKYKGYDVSEGIDTYYTSLGEKRPNFVRGDANIRLVDVHVNHSPDEIPVIKRLDDLIIGVTIEINSKFESAALAIVLFDYEQKSIGICIGEEPVNELGTVLSRSDNTSVISVTLKLPRINLSKGIYNIAINLAERRGSKPLAKLLNIKSFQVTSKRDVWPPLELEGFWMNEK